MRAAMVLRLLTPAAFCAVSAAAALASTSPAITSRDNGMTFTVQPGGTLTLQLPERRWLNPRVKGAAIRLTQVNFVRDPGYRQWSVTALAPGEATIAVVHYLPSGKRKCDPGPCSPRVFRVTILVR
jgi:hypothetical protein